jgi:phosphoribosyl 1,2-cyclic phosphodiesterase
MSVKFWGVRGSIAVPGAETLRYGGNTPCIEVRCNGRLVILDGGTGLRVLGGALAGAREPLDADIFLSHCHMDHVAGLPFFLPLLDASDRIRIWAGNLLPRFTLTETLKTLMGPPLFPVGLHQVQAKVEALDFRAGEPIKLADDLIVKTAPLQHPDGGSGYRLEFRGKILAYVSDTELGTESPDQRLVTLARGADLLIADSTYTEEEIVDRRGWGHSTWQDTVRLANAAGAKSLCLFHHDPAHGDDMMDAIGAEARAAHPGTVVAREGLQIDL